MTATNAIKIENLCKSFPGVEALKDINFSIKEGSVHGFVGPNGAGKSTTMKIISGLIKKTSGKVEIFGHEVGSAASLPLIKTWVGILPEHPPLYLDMRVEDYLKFVAGIHDVPRSKINSYVNEIMEKTGLGEKGRKLIGHLSRGYQQKVGIAQAMVFKPKILILDEPTLGLDPLSILEIRKLIDSLKGEQTIFLSTHHLQEVTSSCSDLTIIHQGKIIVSDSLERVTQRFYGKANGKQVITAEVDGLEKNLEESLVNLLQDRPLGSDLADVVEVKVEETAAKTKKLTFYFDEMNDQRAFIGKFLIEKGCQLLSLSKETLPLEDIFLQAIHEENS